MYYDLDTHSSKVRSPLDSKAVNGLSSFPISPTNEGPRLPNKRPISESEFHQRSYSAAMGPMGANENHGPMRTKVSQENLSHNHEGVREGRRFKDNDTISQQRNRLRGEENEEDELEDDDDMDERENKQTGETDEENVDELMDEDELDDNGSDRHNRSFYPHPEQQQPFGAPHHPQQHPHPSHGSRSLPNILPRPGAGYGSGYNHDGSADDQRYSGMSTWNATTESPRQGGPRNNRPLQARPPNSEQSLTQGGEHHSQPNNHSVNSTNGAEASNGAAANRENGGSFGNTASVNNGSSKKRTTPAKHKCPQCDKYFTRPFNLKSHQRTHTQERPFVCSFAHCARAFSRLHDCNRHMRTHWRIKPYSCPECHRNFVRQDALTRHLRLDFGHNRCSGYPGPVPGSNQDKSEESGDDHMEDSPTETPSNNFSASQSGEVGNATAKAGPPYMLSTSPISPTTASPAGQGQAHGKGQAVPTLRPDSKQEPESERTMPASSASVSASVSAPAQPMRDQRMSQMPSSAPEPIHPSGFESQDEREQGMVRRDSGGPQSRYASGNAPMSFVHRSGTLERRAVTPPSTKETPAFLSQHGRSFSHSSFSHGQPSAPVTSSPMSAPLPSVPPPSGAISSQDRRGPPSHGRNGGSWPGPGQDPSTPPSEYYHGAPHSRQPPPGPIITRSEAPEYERARTFTHPPSDYPPSPSEARRASPSEWNASGPDRWGWDQQRHQEVRHRHAGWSSAPPSRGPMPSPHPQDQAPHPPIPPPRASTMDSWPRGGPPSSPLSREELTSPRGPVRIPQRPPTDYPSSPYPLEPGAGGHGARSVPGGPPTMGRSIEPLRRPELDHDRLRSMTDIDRVRGPAHSWSEQRSRSFHELDAGAAHRSRFEQLPHSPQHPREPVPIGRAPAPEATSSGPERPHTYSGVVGAERHPQSGPYQERDFYRESGKPPMMKDHVGRDYPVRSQSTTEYDADREGFHHQSRYPSDPKVMARESRRSMSPGPPRRFLGSEGRPYEGGNVRYSHQADRPEPYSREEAERMSGRPFRNEERLVMSPLPREDLNNGYFGSNEPGRPNSYRVAGHGYPQGPTSAPLPHPHQRPHESPQQRHPDAHYDPSRRERHSLDMPLTSPTSAIGPPPVSKRSLSSAVVTSR
ncbi:hypothetical protein BX616_003056 [Lobosporangium transversale]|nr:hypothetical protein BX616_003056 [Lobosporangium transversale]